MTTVFVIDYVPHYVSTKLFIQLTRCKWTKTHPAKNFCLIKARPACFVSSLSLTLTLPYMPRSLSIRHIIGG